MKLTDQGHQRIVKILVTNRVKNNRAFGKDRFVK